MCWIVTALVKRNALRWRHNERDSVSNHQPHDCLLNRLFIQTQIKENIKAPLHFWLGNSQGTGEFPAQMASNVENVSIWWRHHGKLKSPSRCTWSKYGPIFHSIDTFYIHGYFILCNYLLNCLVCQVWNVKVLLDSDSRSMFFYLATQSWHRLQYVATIADKRSTVYIQKGITMMMSSTGNIFRVTGPLCVGIHRSLVNSPHKGQWRGALMDFFYLSLNKPLSKQLWGWWLEAPSR